MAELVKAYDSCVPQFLLIYSMLMNVQKRKLGLVRVWCSYGVSPREFESHSCQPFWRHGQLLCSRGIAFFLFPFLTWQYYVVGRDRYGGGFRGEYKGWQEL